MNLKERGITVGDLVLILIFVITSVLIFNKAKKSEKQTYLQIAPKEVTTVKRS